MRPTDFITLSRMTTAPESLSIAHADTPFGAILLAASQDGLTHIWLNTDGAALGRMQDAHPKTRLIEENVPHHAAALSHFTASPQALRLHLKGTDFQFNVWRALLDISLGATSSYKAVATKIGNPKAVRAVGSAVGRNPVFYIVPCHRVLAHDKGMGGYFWGVDVKRKILDWEAPRP